MRKACDISFRQDLAIILNFFLPVNMKTERQIRKYLKGMTLYKKEYFQKNETVEPSRNTLQIYLPKNTYKYKSTKISSKTVSLCIVVVVFPDKVSCSCIMNNGTITGINTDMIDCAWRRTVKNQISGL